MILLEGRYNINSHYLIIEKILRNCLYIKVSNVFYCLAANNSYLKFSVYYGNIYDYNDLTILRDRKIKSLREFINLLKSK